MSDKKTHAERRVTEHWTTRDGTGVVWADIDTRHLWNIARLLLRRVRSARQDARKMQELVEWLGYEGTHPYTTDITKAARARQLSFCFTIDELAYRGVLPSQDDLRVAWDRAMACGAEPWCFVEMWVAFRGESTMTPEYLAQQAQANA